MKWIWLAAALGGCVTGEQVLDAEQARFRSFNGMTMSQFMVETLTTPHQSFDQGGKRVFAADKGQCSMMIETIRNGARTGSDGWIVTSIRRQGGCAGV